jgi:cytochrome P450
VKVDLLWVIPNHTNIHLGHGRHACPGRFFASAELKIVLLHILQHYDIELCDDYRKDRPLNSFVEVMAAQDVTYELRFRRRV